MVHAQQIGAGNEPGSGPSGRLDGRLTAPGAYEQFKKDLNKTLTQMNLKPGVDRFHYVFLYNAVDTQSPEAEELGNIYYGMLHYYLKEPVKNGARTIDGDHITFVPFQLQPRFDNSIWDESFVRRRETEFNKLASLFPQIDPGHKGGHDVEEALLQVTRKIQSDFQNVAPDSIYIVLTKEMESQYPVGDTHYELAKDKPDFQTRMEQAHLTMQCNTPFVWQTQDPSRGAIQHKIYYRIYTPAAGLTQLATGPTGNDHLVSHASSPPAPPGNDGASIWLIVLLTMLVVGGVIGYMAYLLKPRTVMVGVHNLRSVVVSYRVPVDLGKIDDNKGAFSLDGLDDVTEGERLARLSVNLSGCVELSSRSWIVTGSPVRIDREKKIRLSRSKNVTDQELQDSITLTVSPVRRNRA
jgi:hypothetical protein